MAQTATRTTTNLKQATAPVARAAPSNGQSSAARPEPSPAPLRIAAPRIFTGHCREAHELALAHTEPVFMPITPHADDRGWSYMNLLQGVMSAQGQVNYSVQYPGVVKAWHRHEKQTDFWICVSGHIKAGVHREAGNLGWMLVMGEKRPGVLIIPPGLWHGAACIGCTPSGLLYYVTHAYDPAHPDELRRPWNALNQFPWETHNG